MSVRTLAELRAMVSAPLPRPEERRPGQEHDFDVIGLREDILDTAAATGLVRCRRRREGLVTLAVGHHSVVCAWEHTFRSLLAALTFANPVNPNPYRSLFRLMRDSVPLVVDVSNMRDFWFVVGRKEAVVGPSWPIP